MSEFSGTVLEPNPLRVYTKETSIRTPAEELNMGDLDDEDYSKLLILQREIDS